MRFFLILTLALLVICPASANMGCEDNFHFLNLPAERRQALEQLTKTGRWQEAAWKALENGDEATYKFLEKKIESILAKSPLHGDMELAASGSSEVYKVNLGDGVQGIFKPSLKHWKKKRIKPFHDERFPDKEVAAYAFDRAVGGHLVPVTVKRTIDGMEGSLQIFVHMDANPMLHAAPLPGQIREANRLRVLDYMMLAHDRTPMNYPAMNGAPVAIDNAMTFLTKSPHLSFGIQNPPRREEIHNLAKYGEALATYKDIDETKARQAIESILKPEEVEEAMKRVVEVKALGRRAAGLE
jgi:hypothetical protein